MTSTSATVCGFVPLRGTAEQAEGCVRLADDVVLHLDTGDLPDEAALSHALTYPPHTHWTGIQIRDDEPPPTLTCGWPPPATATSAGSP
jgi:protein-L-isoaspartate(D-aspartate) O-methyltransferase